MNLDGAESMSVASIKSELKRRQDVFNRNGVNNIKYSEKLYQATEPMPHLFIISDEFAGAQEGDKSEFMAELCRQREFGRRSVYPIL